MNLSSYLLFVTSSSRPLIISCFLCAYELEFVNLQPLCVLLFKHVLNYQILELITEHTPKGQQCCSILVNAQTVVHVSISVTSTLTMFVESYSLQFKGLSPKPTKSVSTIKPSIILILHLPWLLCPSSSSGLLSHP